VGDVRADPDLWGSCGDGSGQEAVVLDGAGDSQWIHYFDELELAGETVRCACDLGQGRQAGNSLPVPPITQSVSRLRICCTVHGPALPPSGAAEASG